jgi:hypothetical protein
LLFPALTVLPSTPFSARLPATGGSPAGAKLAQAATVPSSLGATASALIATLDASPSFASHNAASSSRSMSNDAACGSLTADTAAAAGTRVFFGCAVTPLAWLGFDAQEGGPDDDAGVSLSCAVADDSVSSRCRFIGLLRCGGGAALKLNCIERFTGDPAEVSGGVEGRLVPGDGVKCIIWGAAAPVRMCGKRCRVAVGLAGFGGELFCLPVDPGGEPPRPSPDGPGVTFTRFSDDPASGLPGVPRVTGGGAVRRMALES